MASARRPEAAEASERVVPDAGEGGMPVNWSSFANWSRGLCQAAGGCQACLACIETGLCQAKLGGRSGLPLLWHVFSACVRQCQEVLLCHV